MAQIFPHGRAASMPVTENRSPSIPKMESPSIPTTEPKFLFRNILRASSFDPILCPGLTRSPLLNPLESNNLARHRKKKLRSDQRRNRANAQAIHLV
jgi:hypothetical protein